MGKCYGVIGDLADCFPGGEIKELLLSEWIASELRSKARLPPDVKKNLRWARDVSSVLYNSYSSAHRDVIRWSNAPLHKHWAAESSTFLFLSRPPYIHIMQSITFPCTLLPRPLKEAQSYPLHVIDGGSATSRFFFSFPFWLCPVFRCILYFVESLFNQIFPVICASCWFVSRYTP